MAFTDLTDWQNSATTPLGASRFNTMLDNQRDHEGRITTAEAATHSTYAALQAFSGGAANEAVHYVHGRAGAGDGGEGFFVYDSADTTTLDDGGSILVDAAGRRWKRPITNHVIAEWWPTLNIAFGKRLEYPLYVTRSHTLSATCMSVAGNGRSVYFKDGITIARNNVMTGKLIIIEHPDWKLFGGTGEKAAVLSANHTNNPDTANDSVPVEVRNVDRVELHGFNYHDSKGAVKLYNAAYVKVKHPYSRTCNAIVSSQASDRHLPGIEIDDADFARPAGVQVNAMGIGLMSFNNTTAGIFATYIKPKIRRPKITMPLTTSTDPEAFGIELWGPIQDALIEDPVIHGSKSPISLSQNINTKVIGGTLSGGWYSQIENAHGSGNTMIGTHLDCQSGATKGIGVRYQGISNIHTIGLTVKNCSKAFVGLTEANNRLMFIGNHIYDCTDKAFHLKNSLGTVIDGVAFKNVDMLIQLDETWDTAIKNVRGDNVRIVLELYSWDTAQTVDDIIVDDVSVTNLTGAWISSVVGGPTTPSVLGENVRLLNCPDRGPDMLNWKRKVIQAQGLGAPAIACGVGSTYQRWDGGATTTFYVKTAGTDATGWTGK